ncbi:MAG TPA: FAD-dependent oxidoreductase, partial [Mycobacteriales bacterium]|nr:FAD-dependent oxidoreductase [Mycobacteriales bacterium]
MTRIAVVGGGPAGYEAALVAVQLGAEVTLVDRDGVGGMCVLADCVPSKTLIATSDALTQLGSADHVGVRVAEGGVHADLAEVNQRVKSLALAQSADISARLVREGVTVLRGHARLLPGRRVQVDNEVLATDVVLLATGATPRVLAGAEPDGERILDWRQLYDLPALPEHLVVVGSGVTGAEFASAYL